jgi:NTE family protein
MIDPDFRHGGLLEGAAVLEGLCRDHDCGTFEELAIPLKVVATDFWGRRSVVLENGPLQTAVQASMALPGVFNPVEIDGRVYIDGGTMNPVPYDVLPEHCELVIAIDVNGGLETEGSSSPGYFDVVFGSIQMLQQAIVERQLDNQPPDISISLDLGEFRTLEFHKADKIYRHVQPAKEELKRRLTKELES